MLVQHLNARNCKSASYLMLENSFFLVGKSLFCINLLSNNCHSFMELLINMQCLIFRMTLDSHRCVIKNSILKLYGKEINFNVNQF